jgi:nitroreductase
VRYLTIWRSSGANHQPWHFAVIGSDEVKVLVREKAEKKNVVFTIRKKQAKNGLMLSRHWALMQKNLICNQRLG